MYNPSKLFGRPGFIPLKEYREDIEYMNKYGPWRLPIGIGDRIHIFFLKIITKLSWFADILHIAHTSTVSPAYTILFSSLKKHQLADTLEEKIIHCPGYFSYSLTKKVSTGGQARTISGYGIAEDRATALSKTFGEMLERIISGMYDMNRNIVTDSPYNSTRKFPTLYPPKFHRFLPIQKEKFPELHNDETKPIAWAEGENLITKERVYIPMQITSWFIKNPNEAPLLNTTTSGSAGYFTKEGAVLRGLLETIERDAFLVHWLTQIPPQVIDQVTLPKKIQEKIQRFKSIGISLSILDVTTLSIPSVIIVAINQEAEIPQIVLSGSSATTFDQAIQDSIREMAISAEMFYYKATDEQLQEIAQFKPFISRLGQIGRQLYWRGPEKIKQFQWFLSGKQVSYDELCKQDLTEATDDTTQLKVCLDVLKKRGPDYYPIVYFPKHPIQKELGFSVAQVFVPKAFPLYLLECQGTFDSDRLQEFAESKGVSEWTLNPLPHMFP